MREVGIDMRDHRSQPTTPELLLWADHIIVMEPGHASHIIQMQPKVEERIVRLWDYLDEEAEEVYDPHRQTIDVFRTSCKSLGDAVKKLITEHLAARRAARAGALESQ